jgi:hypothetical protein
MRVFTLWRSGNVIWPVGINRDPDGIREHLSAIKTKLCAARQLPQSNAGI